MAGMDDQRIGRIVRALRRRLGWRQSDLAARAGVSQSTISFIERGRLRHISLPTLRRVLAATDAWLALVVHWQAGALERLLDEDHAALVARFAELLRRAGWLVEVEVTYSEFGERGSFDIVAFHPEARMLLVIEVKTDLSSAEATLRKLDEKVRLARKVVAERFGWQVTSITRLLVLNDASTIRRRVARHEALFSGALPMRNVAIRRWLRAPAPARGGLLFVSTNDRGRAIPRRGGRERVRVPKSTSGIDEVAA